MTAREQSITRWLVEKVCGGSVVCGDSQEFAPLTDPRDCAVVMEAFCRTGNEITQHIYKEVADAAAITALGHFSVVRLSWTQAVCEAIARASGIDPAGGI